MATTKIQTGLRLNESLYDKLRALAAQESRSLNNLLEYIAQQYVTAYEAERGPIPPLDET
jgi:hypothetical protein